MEEGGFLKNKKLVKNTTIISVWFVVIALISSSSLSANPSNNFETNSSNLRNTEEETSIVVETSAGIAPKIDIKNSNLQTNQVVPFSETMRGYIASSNTYDEGTCKFPLEDPGTIEFMHDTMSDDFLSGGTGTSDEKWLAVEYDDGDLWDIDWETGYMECIGGGGTGLNGLAWDPVYNRLYGVSGSGLYEIDPETGEQEFIGAFGSGVNEMIGIAVDLDGTMYGWDLGDKLWEIDIETAESFEIGPLGIDLNYAQDGGFDYDTGTLWLSAYTTSPNEGSFLYYCDIDTAECVLIGQIEANSQITASVVSLSMCCTEHDVGVKSIDVDSGYAIPDIPMEVTIKNFGANTETTDVQMWVDNYEDGDIILEEDFSGSFPPDGWTTDCWEQSDTDYACGEAPEARCNKYSQYNQSQYYDNYIATKTLNCSDIEAVEVSFRLTLNTFYHQYCNFYLWYRVDSNSPWKSITPWDNPMQFDISCEYFSISIYGDPYLGEEFQVKWGYIGYYYYFNNIYLDDVKIQQLNNNVEYAELVEDITLDPGKSVTVEFPPWTPNYWQDPDYENTWQEYPINACTLLEGDQRPSNDDKKKYVDLYYPWMHDIEITSVYPSEDGPGMTFDVETTIKNVGQYAECCIPIDISIGEPVVLETLLAEDSWDAVPPEGWYDEHKDFSESYGWEKSFTSFSGGYSPEAILRYHKAKPDHVFYSYAINTSDYSSCQLEFLSYINHWSGQGLYALEAGYSIDGDTWFAAWHEEPSSTGAYEVSVILEGGHETVYIGFWVKGDPYYFNYWYIDDITVELLDYVSEYSDIACQGDDIEPGESRTFAFDDWMPDYLQYETTGEKDYIIQAEINMEGDKNPGNDIFSEYFTLDYWHDAVIWPEIGTKNIRSPGDGNFKRDLLWENGYPDGRDAIAGSMYQGHSNIIIDDFTGEKWWAEGGRFNFIWNNGSGIGNLKTVRVYIFENKDDCNPSLEEYVVREVTAFTEEYTGDYYFGRPEIVCTIEFDGIEVYCGLEEWWIGFQPEGIADDIAYLLTAPSKGCEVMADIPYWGYPRWTSSEDIWGEDYDLAWALYGYTGCGCPNVFIPLGIEDIDAIAANYGTFPEMDLTCYAKIYEYITDPENETLVYEDNITDIDLDEPLGGEKLLKFEDYDFSVEGFYRLYLEMPAPNDDHPTNNHYSIGVRVDDTPPISSHELDPPEPDGENGWYVNDVEVILEAYDPFSNNVASGVEEIYYRVNDGPVETISGPWGNFYLTQEHDEEDISIEYWAIDNVGNEETQHHTFTIDMDQTNPSVDLVYEVMGGNPVQGWTLRFTAYATDETSGMERVEFYLNEVFQKAVTGSGPEYQWSFIYHDDLNIDVLSYAYDKAGNMATDMIENPETNIYNQFTQQQVQRNTKPYFLHNSQQKFFVIYGV